MSDDTPCFTGYPLGMVKLNAYAFHLAALCRPCNSRKKDRV